MPAEVSDAAATPAELRDQTIIITGGGSGIGRATALAFAAREANVLVVGRRPEPLSQTESAHTRIRAATADITVEDEVQRVVEVAVKLWDRVDVVVNNAGAFAPGPLESVSVDHIQRLVATNVVAPTVLARTSLPYLRLNGGSIVNVSSTYAQKAAAKNSHYAATKAALESMTRSWALELAPLGIRVNAVSPGPTETELLGRSGLPAAMIDQIKARETATIPLGRRGEPDDVAHWIVALADPSAAWVTGQVLPVDGGLSLV